ncbi:MAG: translation initiation factor 2 [Oscillospiraceae bacterium]|nr:translation initiation factor 2 [Oscillospiraceae bacterium]
MIKGISRRVIVVRSPDRRFFEEAIFIVREGVIGQGGVTADQVVEEARRVADGYVKKHHARWYHRIPAPLYAALGAALATVAWYAAALFPLA